MGMRKLLRTRMRTKVTVATKTTKDRQLMKTLWMTMARSIQTVTTMKSKEMTSLTSYFKLHVILLSGGALDAYI